jgi:hypothetical protein
VSIQIQKGVSSKNKKFIQQPTLNLHIIPLHALMFEDVGTHVGIIHLFLTVSGKHQYFACSNNKNIYTHVTN